MGSKYYVKCMKLVAYKKGYLFCIEEWMKTLIGLSRERYTYVLYIFIDEQSAS